MPIAEKEKLSVKQNWKKMTDQQQKRSERNSRKSESNIPDLYIPQDRYYIHNNLE